MKRFFFVILLLLGVIWGVFSHFSRKYVHVTGSSMLPTLQGGTIHETCSVCGFRGPRIATGTSVCTNCGWLTSERMRQTDEYRKKAHPEAVADVFLPFVPQKTYAIDDVVVCTPNKKTGTIIKRIAGLPGDTLEVRDGALFRNGTRAVRNLETWKQMRIPVYFDDFRPENVSRWQPIATGEGILTGKEVVTEVSQPKNGWIFRSTEPTGIMYAHRKGRFEAQPDGTLRCQMIPAPITNFRGENGTEFRTDAQAEIQELMATFTLHFPASEACCVVSLPTLEGEWLFVLIPETHKTEQIIVRVSEKLRQAVTQGRIQPLCDGTFSAGIYFIRRASTVTVSTLDGFPRVSCGDEKDHALIAPQKILNLRPSVPEYEGSASADNFRYLSTARIWCWGDFVEIQHLSLFRGEYWENISTNFNYFSQNTKKLLAFNCNWGYYLVGDNFFVSQDSRQLGEIPPEKIHGRVILPHCPPH